MGKRHGAFALAVVVAAIGVGCGGSDQGSGKSSSSGLLGSVSSAIKKLDQDLKSPSGVVSATSAQGVLAQGASQDAAQNAFSMGGAFGGGSYGQSWFGVPPGFQPMADGAGASACIEQTASSMSIDLGCLGKEKGVEASGSISLSYEQDGQNVYATFTYAKACVASAETGATVCIDGSGALQSEGQNGMAFTGDFTVDMGGTTEKLKFGYRQSYVDGTLSLQYASYDENGDSYVLGAKLSASSGEISIKGKNGEFTCSYSEGGAAGQCSDGGGETFDWGGAPTG